MAPSPEGTEIVRNKRAKFVVGKKLGSGACATVHELKDSNGVPTKYAIKIAPLPQKKSKKGKTEEEMNAQLIFYEQLIYQNQLAQLCGTYIPSLPNSLIKEEPPVYGEENGTSKAA